MNTWSDFIHMSFKCKIYSGRRMDHSPCAGTCDGHGTGVPCKRACECSCHDQENVVVRGDIL